MALVNVAVELVKSGRRVLIVDFDLEAPGLDTFNLPRPTSGPPSGGIVDFVHQYLKTGESPDAADFIYASNILGSSGKLFVMPAGIQDSDYDTKFKEINWQDLYENREGYLLFEDLKAQWKKLLDVDYVLLDSRTGHTDISGICTRQLPDSVVLFFFPNEQNRRGLETVVKQIRAESRSDRKKDIKLHFVMSNVPELDDEEGFLANNVAILKETLGCKEFSAIIHHYNSLALLTQSVFTLDRPRTRLAHEYQDLARVIRKDNLEDREVALAFLDEIAPLGRRRSLLAPDLEQKIQNIRSTHANDPEVLTRLAILLRRERRFDEALALFESAGSLGASSAEFFLARAELFSFTNNKTAALDDLNRLLSAKDATYLEVNAAARLLFRLEPDSLGKLIETEAFKRLDPEGKLFVAHRMTHSRRVLPISTAILYGLWEIPSLSSALNSSVRNELICTLIGEGRYKEALDLISSTAKHSPSELDIISEAFNGAMADWGMKLFPSVELFKRVVELESQTPVSSPNGNECLAIALWITDRPQEARARLTKALQQIMTKPEPEFSAWSYLRLPPNDFMEDLKELQSLIEGGTQVPRFIRENRLLTQ